MIRHNCHREASLPVHIFSAIACRRTALHRANAMITQVGFHDMPSAVWRQGRATQVVNPLNTLSLLAASRSGSCLPGHAPGPVTERGILAGARRPSSSLAAPRRRPSGRPGPAGTRVPSSPRRPGRPGRRPSGRPEPDGTRVPSSPRRPSHTLTWTSGRASVGWCGRDGAPMRPLSRRRSPVSHPVSHPVRRPTSPPRPAAARAPWPSGPSPPRAARPPRRLIPR